MKLFHDLSHATILLYTGAVDFAISLNEKLLLNKQRVTKTNYRQMFLEKTKTHNLAKLLLVGLIFLSVDLSAQLETNTGATSNCVCNNDQSSNGAGDGTFSETLVFTGPCGLEVFTGSGSQPPALANLPFTSSTPDPMTGLCDYSITFNHTDGLGYDIFVTDEMNNPYTGSGTADPINPTNVCAYPVITDPVVDMTDLCFNGDPLQFDGDEVMEVNGYDGFVQVYLGGITTGQLITEFDPSLYENGIYELTFLFSGDNVSNVWDGVTPAFPGCQTSTSVSVGIGGGGTLACNDNVNVSVNGDCEVEFTWYSLIEDDNVPPLFDTQFEDSVGNIVSEDELDNYIGQSLTYSIIDICNGNSCWGTLNIEDKSIPELECDCPVGGETGIGDYSEDCTLSCYELPIFKERYWDRLRDNLITEDFDDFIDDYVNSVCDDVTADQVSFYDVYVDLDCGGTLLQRTWSVSYDKGNDIQGTVSCTFEYYFQPLGLETADTARIDPMTGSFVIAEDSLVLPVEVVEMTCGADISPAAIAAFFDNPNTEDKDTDDNRIDPDELDIDLIVENNEGIPYAYPHYYIQGRNPSGPHPQAIDNEVCNLLVTYTDNEVEACAVDCGGNRKILRNWTILDWCIGEYITYGQVVKAIDQDGPTIDVPDAFASVDPWKCSADVLLPQPEHLYDDCGGEVTYSIGFVSGGLSVTGNAEDGYILLEAEEGQIYDVEYVAEDCCGNRTSVYIKVQVADLTPPVPVTKENIVLSLSNIGNPVDENQGIAKLYAEDIDNGSYDGCTDIDLAVRRTEIVCPDQDTLWADYVKFCCEDLNGMEFVEIDVQFRVRDTYGNENFAWATVRLEDKSSNTQTCPPDMILTCDMDYNDFTVTGLPRVFGACGELEVVCDLEELIEDTEPRRKGPFDGHFNDPRYDGVEVPAYDPTCGYGAVRRQFRSCSSCVQWFVIEPIDPFDPNTIEFPDDVIVDCNGGDYGEPSWDITVCELIGVSLEADTFRFEDGACIKILNHWSVINWCNYDPTDPNSAGRYNHTQVVKIIDSQDPIITAVDSLMFPVDDACVSAGGELTARANDEGVCGSDWLKWELTLDLNADWTQDYFYSSELPEYVNGVPNPYYISPTGNDELAVAVIPSGIASSKIWHRAVWRVSDGCTNSMSVVRYFQITDKKDPTPYCLNLSTAVMGGNGQVELWAIDFNVGSFDNCTDDENIIFTFTDVPPPPRDDSEYDSSSDLQWYNGNFWYFDPEDGDYMDQDDYFDLDAHRWEPGLRSTAKIFTMADADPSGHVNIPIYAWDECGNSDFCIVNMRLIDNNGAGEGAISGKMVTEEGKGVDAISTELSSDLQGFPKYDLTDNQGRFAFYSVPFNADYLVNGSKKNDYLNGVSTLDILLIQRHILGQDELDSPYKMIAADINQDLDISAIDLIELRKLILGVYSELPQNDSWKAVDAAQILTTENPWIYRDYIEINNLENNKMDADFIAVKIGDVNLSAQPQNGKTQDPNTLLDIMELDYEDQLLKEGDVVELGLKSTTSELYGYQMTLEIPGFEVLDVKGAQFDEAQTAVFDDKLTISHAGISKLGDGEILTIRLRAQTPGWIAERIRVSSDITKAEAYLGQNLRVVDINTTSQNQESSFYLYQNQPNPFKAFTEIGFDLPSNEMVRLEFFDVSGKRLRVINHNGVKGYNKVKVDRSSLNGGGVIYYTLTTKEHTATKHMIMIE